MRLSAKTSRQRYNQHLEEQRKKKEIQAKQAEEEQQTIQKKEQFDRLLRDEATLKAGMIAADQVISAGNDEMKDLLSQKNMDMELMKQAQAKIEMGLKRKSDIESEIKNLEEKRKKLI